MFPHYPLITMNMGSALELVLKSERHPVDLRIDSVSENPHVSHLLLLLFLLHLHWAAKRHQGSFQRGNSSDSLEHEQGRSKCVRSSHSQCLPPRATSDSAVSLCRQIYFKIKCRKSVCFCRVVWRKNCFLLVTVRLKIKFHSNFFVFAVWCKIWM